MSTTTFTVSGLVQDPKFWIALIPVTLAVLIVRQLTVPRELRHLPIVPILPLLWSYISGEAENERIERLYVPFANEKGEGLVVVYALGRWISHVLDPKVSFFFPWVVGH